MSKIQWTEKTWNPIRGCSRVSEGCRNCYAMRMARRQDKPGKAYEGLTRMTWNERAHAERVDWSGGVRFVPERLDKPLRWRKPRHVFVNSMGDLFHEKLTNEQIAAVFGVMAACPQHTFQVLTKRPRRMVEWFEWVEKRERDGRSLFPLDDSGWRIRQMLHVSARRVGASVPEHHGGPWPLPNVWLGVTAEDQQRADERIPLLLQVPAAVRFVSVEPLLDAVDLSPWLYCQACGYGREAQLMHGDHRLCGAGVDRPGPTVLDWVIAGCESGPGARPAETDWFRSLRDQCQEAGVPFFLKQMMQTNYGGSRAMAKAKLVKMPTLDGKVWDEVPT
jgi:protein gp37